MTLAEGMTNGVKKALIRLTGDKQRSVCKKCGFVLPKYPGRYPSHCPVCGSKRDEALKAPSIRQDNLG